MEENEIVEALARKAYETHIGIFENNDDNYFRLDVTKWEELSKRSQGHWKNIALAVLRFAQDIDCGDL
jgi:hypothetical protein